MTEHAALICPKCQKAPIESIMYSAPVYLPYGGIVYGGEFQDEQGRWHSHGRHCRTIYCPHGHSWVVDVIDSCWCGWPDTGPYMKEETDGSHRGRSVSGSEHGPR